MPVSSSYLTTGYSSGYSRQSISTVADRKYYSSPASYRHETSGTSSQLPSSRLGISNRYLSSSITNNNTILDSSPSSRYSSYSRSDNNNYSPRSSSLASRSPAISGADFFEKYRITSYSSNRSDNYSSSRSESSRVRSLSETPRLREAASPSKPLASSSSSSASSSKVNNGPDHKKYHNSSDINIVNNNTKTTKTGLKKIASACNINSNNNNNNNNYSNNCESNKSTPSKSSSSSSSSQTFLNSNSPIIRQINSNNNAKNSNNMAANKSAPNHFVQRNKNLLHKCPTIGSFKDQNFLKHECELAKKDLNNTSNNYNNNSNTKSTTKNTTTTTTTKEDSNNNCNNINNNGKSKSKNNGKMLRNLEMNGKLDSDEEISFIDSDDNVDSCHHPTTKSLNNYHHQKLDNNNSNNCLQSSLDKMDTSESFSVILTSAPQPLLQPPQSSSSSSSCTSSSSTTNDITVEATIIIPNRNNTIHLSQKSDDSCIRVRNALPPSLNSSPSIASDTTTATYTVREPYRSTLRKLSDSNEEKSDSYNSIKENGERKASTNNSLSSYRTEGLCGLWNIGNTCFMNSVIQCLSHTRELTKYMRALPTTPRGTAKEHRVLVEYTKLMNEMWNSNNKSVNPTEFKFAFSSKHRMYSGSAQQDAQEFLRYFLDTLHGGLNTAIKPEPVKLNDSLSNSEKSDLMWDWYSKTENSIVKDLFVGQLRSTLKCTVCGTESLTFDPFWDLSLPMPAGSSRCELKNCLDIFSKEDVLDGNNMPKCAHCNTRRKCTKRFTIQRFPKYLVIHLKRFSETRWSKITNVVEFPTGERELNLSSYAPDDNTSSAYYSLYGISNHMGSTHGGHYVAMCKHPITKKWHEFNDNFVTETSESSLVSSSAYLLFYERA